MQLSYSSAGDSSLRRSRDELVEFRGSAFISSGGRRGHHLEGVPRARLFG